MKREDTRLRREEALGRIAALREKYADKNELLAFNEAKTRLLVIDETLIALGWSKESFNPELNSGPAGFCDYLLSVDHCPRVVVEAKRTGHTFSSTKKHTQSEYSIAYVRSASVRPLLMSFIRPRSTLESMAYPSRFCRTGASGS